MGKDPLGNSIKCAFDSTLRSQNTRFQAENPKSVFGNKMQMRVLEKPIFQIQKTCTFLCGSWARVFCKKPQHVINITVGSYCEFPKLPTMFQKANHAICSPQF